MTDEGLLGGQAEPAGGGSGGDDERAGAHDVLADGELEGRLADVGRGEVAHGDLGAEAGGLLLHVLDELGTLNALGPAGEVFDEGCDGELAAGLVAFEDEGLEVGTGGVDGRGQSRAAGAEDDGVAYGVGLGHIDLIVEGGDLVQAGMLRRHIEEKLQRKGREVRARRVATGFEVWGLSGVGFGDG